MATASERFYEKIVSIDLNAKNLTVHNNRQQIDSKFQWNEQTGMSFNKKPISAGDLKVGQTVGVAGELTESGEIVAKKIEIKAKQS